MQVPGLARAIFVLAAGLAVGGGAVIRKGLRGDGVGTHRGGRRVCGESTPAPARAAIDRCPGRRPAISTWRGLIIIVTGGLLIQFGGDLGGSRGRGCRYATRVRRRLTWRDRSSMHAG